MKHITDIIKESKHYSQIFSEAKHSFRIFDESKHSFRIKSHLKKRTNEFPYNLSELDLNEISKGNEDKIIMIALLGESNSNSPILGNSGIVFDIGTKDELNQKYDLYKRLFIFKRNKQNHDTSINTMLNELEYKSSPDIHNHDWIFYYAELKDINYDNYEKITLYDAIK